VVDRYDAIVIGLGGMGSASVYHLARRGQRVLGLEQFDLLHELGSSHGLTRIIRLAYHEDPSYVPLLRRVYELWHDLETDAGERLVITTGSVEGGPEDGATFRGALHAAELHDLPHEVLDADELRRRYPAYAGFDAATRVVLQADGGFLLAERTILAHVNGALAHSADLRFREAVKSWEVVGDGVRVTTGRLDVRGGSAGHLRRAVGADAGSLAGDAGRARTPGPGLAPADASRAVRAGALPRLRGRREGGQLLRLSRPRRAGLQVRPVPTLR